MRQDNAQVNDRTPRVAADAQADQRQRLIRFTRLSYAHSVRPNSPMVMTGRLRTQDLERMAGLILGIPLP
jgi:hypothetical protein